MNKLADEEILCLIDLLNNTADDIVSSGILAQEAELTHQNSGAKTELVPLIRKFVKEAVSRKLIEIPNCFKGRL